MSALPPVPDNEPYPLRLRQGLSDDRAVARSALSTTHREECRQRRNPDVPASMQRLRGGIFARMVQRRRAKVVVRPAVGNDPEYATHQKILKGQTLNTVQQAIRPFIEDYLRLRFPGRFPNQAHIFEMANAIRDAGPGDPLATSVADLFALKPTCSRLMSTLVRTRMEAELRRALTAGRSSPSSEAIKAEAIGTTPRTVLMSGAATSRRAAASGASSP